MCFASCLLRHRLADTIGVDAETLRALNFLTVGETTPSGEVVKYSSLPTVWQQVRLPLRTWRSLCKSSCMPAAVSDDERVGLNCPS
jgi:hypothetical protein